MLGSSGETIVSEAGTREHALEHLLIGLIRKYGDNGSSVFLEPETYEGHFALKLSHVNGGLLVEALEADELDEAWNEP